MGRCSWVVLVVLALVVTSDCEGLAAVQSQHQLSLNITSNKTGALSNPNIDGHREDVLYSYNNYDAHYAKRYIGGVVFFFILVSNFYLFKDDLIALIAMKNCQDFGQEHDPKHFNELAKLHSNTQPVEITRYETVLLHIENCVHCMDKKGNLEKSNNSTKEHVKIYPYDQEHANLTGGIAFMVYETNHNQDHEEEHNAIRPGDLLVAVDCEQFDEARKSTMKWFPGGISDYLNDGDVNGLSKKFVKSLIFYHAKDEFFFCPSGNGDFLIMKHKDRGNCWDDEDFENESSADLEEEKGRKKKKKKKKKKGGDGDGGKTVDTAKSKNSGVPDLDGDGDTDRSDRMLAVEKFLEDAKGQPFTSVTQFPPGGWDMGRQRLPIRTQRGIDEYTLTGIIFILLYAGSTYAMSKMILDLEIDSSSSDAVFRRLGMVTKMVTAADMESANGILGVFHDHNGQMVVYVLSGLIWLFLFLLACLLIFRILGPILSKRVSRSRSGRLVMQEFMGFTIMALCLWITAKQYVEGRILNSQWSVSFNMVSTSLQWINTYLALIYFADVIIKYLNAFYKFPLFGLFDDRASDLILGVTGALGEMVGMMDQVRGMHGWGSGCELSELGYTFRTIATAAPQSFPVGCELTLSCTESELTFDDVYHLNFNNDSKNNTVNPKFDDGNMCLLQCAVKNTDGEKLSKQTPIWCKDSGLFNARWTLSSHREAQQGVLCPKVTDAVLKPTNLTLPPAAANTTTPTPVVLGIA